MSIPSVPEILGDWVTVVKDKVSTLAVIISSIWAIQKFIMKRECQNLAFAWPELSWGTGWQTTYSDPYNCWNKGLVIHKVWDFKFDLYHLTEDAKIVEGGDEINKQILFKTLSKIKAGYLQNGNMHLLTKE